MKALPNISKSVQRAFEVLELFRDSRMPLSAKEIRNELGFPPGSTYAILKNMADLGFLKYERSARTYFPTLRASRLGDWIQNALISVGPIRDLVEYVQSDVGETTTVNGADGIHTDIIYVQAADHPIAVKIQTGIGAPLCQTVIGRVILSAKPDAEIKKLIGLTNDRMTILDMGQHFDLDEIMESIDKARSQGYLAGYDLWIQGLAAIAFPIPESIDGRPLALAVAGASERIQASESAIVETMKTGFARCGWRIGSS